MKTQLQYIKDWCRNETVMLSDDTIGKILQATTITAALSNVRGSTLAVLVLDLVAAIRAGKVTAA